MEKIEKRKPFFVIHSFVKWEHVELCTEQQSKIVYENLFQLLFFISSGSLQHYHKISFNFIKQIFFTAVDLKQDSLFFINALVNIHLNVLLFFWIENNTETGANNNRFFSSIRISKIFAVVIVGGSVAAIYLSAMTSSLLGFSYVYKTKIKARYKSNKQVSCLLKWEL